ncbi:MAG: hypothetical protein SPF89_03235 [Sphaerochaetaceae bacterium]|nr:hypothetical protein [Spirochaetales bacterium]MDY5499098.1 hypothetical protein [Sphaerochaetaceae bacterium]
MQKRLGVLVLLLSIALPCFAIDAVQTKRGDVYYGKVYDEGTTVNLTHPNGWTEQFDTREVTITRNLKPPTPKTPQTEGNFEIIEGAALKTPINLDNFRKGMLVSLNLNKWRVLSEAPGVLNVSYEKAQISLRLKICYGTQSYWYEYVESNGLQAMPTLGRIQQNYYQLIHQLERQLQIYY